MALETQTVSLNIATSIDQKADSKQIDPTNLAVSNNVRILKKNKVQKRFGRESLSSDQTVLDMTYPVTIGSDTNQSFAVEMDSKTVLYNRGAYYVRDTVNDEWRQEHIQPVCYVTPESVVANSSTYLYQSTIEFGGYRITLAANDQTIDLNVFNLSTRLFEIKDRVIYTRTVSSALADFGAVKVVAMSTDVALLWTDSTVRAAKLTLATMTVGADAVIQADTGGFDAVYMANSSNTAKLAIVTTRVRTYDDNFVYDAGVGELTGFPAINAKSLFYPGSIAPQNLALLNITQEVVAGSITQSFGAQVIELNWLTVAGSITNSASTVTAAPPKTTTGGLMVNAPFYYSAGAVLDPRSASTVRWFVSFFYSSLVPQGRAKEYRTYSFTHNLSGVLGGAATIYSYSGVMQAKPVVVGDSIQVPLLFEYENESSLILTDYYRGKVSGRPYPVAKLCEGEQLVQFAFSDSFPPNNKLPTQEVFISADSVRVYTIVSLEAINLNLRFESRGVGLFSVGRTNQEAMALEVNRGLYVGGAVPTHYDGIEFGEVGFLVKPPAPFFTIGEPVRVEVLQQGTAGLPEITRVTFNGGTVFPQTGAGLRLQFTFPSSSAYFWFNLGSNTDPGGSGTGLEVVIGRTWSAQEILKAFYIKANDLIGDIVGGSTLATTVTLNSITLTNAANGAVADATVTPASVGGQNVPAGTYQARTVYKYVNQKGQVFRSAPSLPVNATSLGSPQAMSVIAPFSDVSARDFQLNEIEVYLTDTNGSIFYLVATNSQFTRKAWVSNDSRVEILGAQTPASAIVSFDPTVYTANRPLYTTGSVLENDYPFNWDKATIHKGRVFLGFPQSDSLTYSKTLVPEEGVAFSDFLTVEFDQANGLTAVASLDEKLIAFTAVDKRLTVGEPANDLGAGQSFSTPVFISSDTGAVSQASIVENTDGIYYKSQKGIYRINRGLSDEYIGAAVEDFNGNTVAKACINSEFNEIVFVLKDSPFALVYNYLFGAWTTWGNSQMSYVFPSRNLIYTTAAGKVFNETRTVFKDIDGNVVLPVAFDIEMPWLKMKGQQDYQRVKQIMILGELKSAHSLQVQFWWDYDKRDAVRQTLSLASSLIVSGSDYADATYQAQFSPWKQKCESIKVRIFDVPDVTTSGESCTLNAVDFRVGMKRGLSKIKEAKQT